jgi:hypothetical protein
MRLPQQRGDSNRDRNGDNLSRTWAPAAPNDAAATEPRSDWVILGGWAGGISVDTMTSMAMTLRLTDAEAEVLRRRAELERRPMQEVVRQAIREYVESHSRAELLGQVLDEELPRYAEALERLAQ